MTMTPAPEQDQEDAAEQKNAAAAAISSGAPMRAAGTSRAGPETSTGSSSAV